MPIAMARKLLPKDSIIGASVNTASEAIAVKAEGLADYVGIGPIWPTKSKKDLLPILGPRSVGPILDELEGTKIKSVVIGMTSSN
jgi:thiamine-phosphate diphosphorylase/hydroxyethylthiazole kinase